MIKKMKPSCLYAVLYAFLLFVCTIACTSEEVSPSAPPKVEITLYDLQTEWATSYEGWDSLMNVKTNIQKQLVLNSDGTYTNFLGGKSDIPNAKEGPFESEGGNYEMELRDSLCRITFLVSYDSIIDFRTQQMVGYSKKLYHTLAGEEYELEVYTQTFSIKIGNENSCVLCGVDSTLFSLDGEGNPVLYEMRMKKREP